MHTRTPRGVGGGATTFDDPDTAAIFVLVGGNFLNPLSTSYLASAIPLGAPIPMNTRMVGDTVDCSVAGVSTTTVSTQFASGSVGLATDDAVVSWDYIAIYAL